MTGPWDVGVAVSAITPPDAGRGGWCNDGLTARITDHATGARHQDDAIETDFDFLSESDIDEILRANEVAMAIIRQFRLVEAVRLCPPDELTALAAIVGARDLDHAARRLGRCQKSLRHAIDAIIVGARTQRQLPLFTVDLPPCVPKLPTRAGRPRKNSEGDV
ncbi:MAG: hypothetical protein ACYCVY_12060 [Acidiferrobacteraceae bacterium]